ncbi:SRPBCC family protein [Demequina rhizosphaerae]|uniref:SRPBCC family protein n=1 Tax=Demequina rhizosphaerae TaxID=1638985 RepID=UPI000782F94D|nr:SRPBCC family protein [Demequina rhizosphaerae]
MVASKHHHVIGVDAPPGKVFAYAADPAHLIAAMPEANRPELVEVARTEDGVVKSFTVEYRSVGMHRRAVFTREEYVPGERIVDHSSVGPVFTYAVKPEGKGTTLSFDWDAARWLKALDAVFTHSDRDIDDALATYKREIEAMV